MISSRAVLEGIGVGDSTVSPTSALLLSVFQDSVGRLATILFAHRLGTSLEPECKMYRFIADIFNDTAMVTDYLSPIYPKTWRLPFWCLSSVLRSMCGVAAGSSKASLSAHFATQGNLGELNAKDSSQETVISLLGLLAGSLLLPYLSKQTTWLWLILLLVIHIGANYFAVKSVCMRTFNRQRANLFFSGILDELHKVETSLMQEQKGANYALNNLISHLKLPSPKEISLKERIFELGGILRWTDGTPLGYCELGVPLKCILECFGSADAKTSSFGILPCQKFQKLLDIYKESDYILYYNRHRQIYLVTIKSHTNGELKVHLKAWIQALYLAKFGSVSDDESQIESLEHACKYADRLVDTIISGNNILKLGWNLETSAMETYPSTRILVKNEYQTVTSFKG